MANAYSTNYTLNSSYETFSAIWKLTRTMMAAGWRYKASGNGYSDWNAAETGTSVTASTFATPVLTLTGLQGMSPGVVGQWITLTGFTGASSGNNGTWLILSYISSTSVTVYNTSGVGSGSGTAWSIVRDSAMDLWGVGGNVNLTNVPSGGSGTGTGVSIGSGNPTTTGQSTITGVSGFSQLSSPGRILAITGSSLGNNGNFRIVSATAAGTSVTVYAPQLVAETSNASLTVTEQYGGATASITTFTSTTSGQSTLINVTGLSGLSASDIGRKIRFLNPASNFSPATTGSAASVTSFTTPTATITGLTGMTPSIVGQYMTFTNAASGGNNGTFQITAYVSSSSVQINNASAVAGDANNGSIKWSVLQVFGNLGSFTIVSVGSSSTATVYAPFAVQTDGNNGSIQWVEWDPLQQTYPTSIATTDGVGAWWLCQGPTIVKVPIGTNVVTGTFIRGENVTQTATGAQGELLGYAPDSSGGTGFLVIAPRVIGTGSDAGPAADTNMTYGWNITTDTVTGATSGATVTSTAGPPIAYIRETMFWKNTGGASSTGGTGHVYHQCIDQNPVGSESPITTTTGRFSFMASTLSQISGTVPPASSTGGSPVTNGFPTTAQGSGSYIGTYVVEGEGGSGSASTGAVQWTGSVNPTSPGKAQLLCANNIEQQLVSADGSWGYYQSCSSIGFQGFAYHRMDNQEDGDLDPYVHQGNFAGTILVASPTRQTETGTGSGSALDNMSTGQPWLGTNQGHGWKGFRRRGLNNTASVQTTEYYSWFSTAWLYDNGTGAQGQILVNNSGNVDQVATSVSLTYVREPIWLYVSPSNVQNNGVRMRKGSPRWLFLTMGSGVLSTFDTKSWIILSTYGATANLVPMVVGPYDGATTPSF